jgi:hypothetical protein
MQEIGLVLLVLFVLVLFYQAFRVRAGRSRDLRPLPGLDKLPVHIGHAAETGHAIHVSVGVAGLGGPATAETWAGLDLLAQLADQAAVYGSPLLVTVADATVLPLAQDIVRRAYSRQGDPEGYDPTQVRLVSTDPTAYAAGVMGLLEREPLTTNVMIGPFGDEYLLIGETGARRGVPQLVGASDPRTLPYVYATADDPLIGEEMFAAGAYTSRLPFQIGSLLTQDLARLVIVVAIVVVAVMRWFGWGL